MGKNKTAAKKAAQEKAVETKKGETKAKVETKAIEVKENLRLRLIRNLLLHRHQHLKLKKTR